MSETKASLRTSKQTSQKARRLILQMTDEGTRILSSVEADGALNRRDRYRQSETFYRIVTKDNRILFSRGFDWQSERRAEFPDENGALTRFPGPPETPVISIAVPVLEEADRLQLLRYKKTPSETKGREAKVASEQDVELIGEVRL